MREESFRTYFGFLYVGIVLASDCFGFRRYVGDYYFYIQWSAVKCPPPGGTQSRLAWLGRGGQPKAKVAVAT
eukprot:scaffold8102_cov73-Cyclotella_meneghiniana.AAC.11